MSLPHLQGTVYRFGEPRIDLAAQHQSVNHKVDVMAAVAVQLGSFVQLVDMPVDANTQEPGALQIIEELAVLSLALLHDRGEDLHLGSLPQRRDLDSDLAPVLGANRFAALNAVGSADARVEDAQVVVDLGDRADGGPRVVTSGLLRDRDRRREPRDLVHVRFLHLSEELPGVGGEGSDVAPLAFGVEGVERHRGFTRAANAGETDQLIFRKFEIDVLEVVNAGAADQDIAGFHR